jgi:hypothetical protein
LQVEDLSNRVRGVIWSLLLLLSVVARVGVGVGDIVVTVVSLMVQSTS